MEFSLLHQWSQQQQKCKVSDPGASGKFSHADVQNFIGTDTDALDLKNLQWSGIFIRNSISERQQELLDKYQETANRS